MDGRKIKELRLQLGLTQEQIAQRIRALGVRINRASISYAERAPNITIGAEFLNALAQSLEVAPYVLLGTEPPEPESIVSIPIVGSVPCGSALPSVQYGEGYIDIAVTMVRDRKTRDLYAVRANGSSLIGDGIEDGDYLIIDREAPFVNGAIYIVEVHNEVLARHCYREADRLKLVASDGYADISLSEANLQGRVILSGKWRQH